jgi:TolB-like protein/Tfp pilus assembly protein PilF
MAQFFQELKRRNVIRVGIAYIAVAWLVLQVAETLLPVYGFTDAAIRNLVAVLGVGLPVALMLAWKFEWTPAGIFKDSDADASTPAARQDNKRLDRFITLILVVAVAFFAVDKFVLDPSRDARNIEAATEMGRAAALLKVLSDKSVAVLPFVNRSPRDDDVYFVDGIHDDILTQLARIGSLVVTSRTSVEQFRGTKMSMKDIGAELGVRAILEGGVQRSGDRVRINVQLINAADDEHLWAETYVRELTAANIFGVQADIASAVAEALRAALLPEEKEALAATPTESMQAYDLYLLGRFHWRKRTKEAIDIARGHFENAIEQDPNYVLALSGLADSYTLLVRYGNMTGEDAYPLAQQAVDQAMAIDDSVSEVWASLGFLRQNQHRLGESEEAFVRALELDPNNFSAWFWYTVTLRQDRRDAEALEALLKAYELEPMSKVVNERLAHQYDAIGDFARAIQHYERADQLDDMSSSGFQIEIAWSYLWAGEYARAIETCRNILIREPDSVGALYGIAVSYLSMGNIREAKLWNDRAAAISSWHRAGFAILNAQQNYAGAIAHLEDTLRLQEPRRELWVLYELFKAHHLNGDMATARTYLAEFLEVQQGRVEIDPRDIFLWRELNVAAFWLTQGDVAAAEPQRGRELAEEIRTSLTAQTEWGWHRPGTLGGLAAANALLGNSTAAIARLNEAIDNGYQNQQLSLNNMAFDSIRNTPEFTLALERIEENTEADKTLLASMDLPPYSPPVEHEPIIVARETLQKYEGWYSNSNALVHAFIGEDGRFMGSLGQDVAGPLLAIADDEFFDPRNKTFTVQFVSDENGLTTHMLVKTDYDDFRWKRVPDPPAVISLPRDVLARYEGTYAYDRLGGLAAERAETDFWVAEIYVDEAGKIWVDYDDQPKLEIAAFSETEFQLIGFEAQYEFLVDPDTGISNHFVRAADGSEIHFYRQ